MVRRDVVSRKLLRATAHANDVEALLARSRDEFVRDVKDRDLAAFYLMLAIQECIDLAAHWVADAGWPAPEDAGAAFDVLAERGAIAADVATNMRAAVGLRNRIVHGYAQVDHGRLYDEATPGPPALRAFLLAVAGAAGV